MQQIKKSTQSEIWFPGGGHAKGPVADRMGGAFATFMIVSAVLPFIPGIIRAIKGEDKKAE